eukprot:674839-Pleurochrysis_carterae.AAC.5
MEACGTGGCDGGGPMRGCPSGRMGMPGGPGGPGGPPRGAPMARGAPIRTPAGSCPAGNASTAEPFGGRLAAGVWPRGGTTPPGGMPILGGATPHGAPDCDIAVGIGALPRIAPGAPAAQARGGIIGATGAAGRICIAWAGAADACRLGGIPGCIPAPGAAGRSIARGGIPCGGIWPGPAPGGAIRGAHIP